MIIFNPVINELEVMVEEGAYTPIRAHATDAGLDIRSPISADIPAGKSVVINTGVHVNLPTIMCGGIVFHTAGILASKSGLNVKNSVTGEGIIDVNYTGAIQVRLQNDSDKEYHISSGDKIIQLLVVPVLTPNIKVVNEFSGVDPNGRGDNGFGSTGK